MGRPQRGAQIAGLGPQAFLALRERPHLLGEGAVRPLALPVERLRLLVEGLQGHRDRL